MKKEIEKLKSDLEKLIKEYEEEKRAYIKSQIGFINKFDFYPKEIRFPTLFQNDIPLLKFLSHDSEYSVSPTKEFIEIVMKKFEMESYQAYNSILSVLKETGLDKDINKYKHI